MTEANHQISARIKNDDNLQGMATTAVAILADGNPPALAHAGDSRAYLLRNEQFSRLTRDHSWVEEQMRAGALTAEVARDHPWRNIVTRALTGAPGLEVEVAENFHIELADRLLLCSDGLTTVLSDEEIATVLKNDLGLQNICEKLVLLANEQGGPDNITVVLFDVDAL